ncbi:MAG: YvcK family protein [Thermosphaera sp.]
MAKIRNITVIGGGTGTYVVLNGIKKLENIDITAIVSSADSGGSTGILRDEFGVLPVGDFRQCLVALSPNPDEGDNILRKLFEYRFNKGGKGLEGHNFGNLFIAALTEVLGSEELAFRKVSKILNIKGKVYPVTFDHIQLVAEYEDGSISYGEKMIDEPSPSHDGTLRIKKLWVQPKAKLFAKSKEQILNSDLIILGPGDLYTSTLANIVIDDFVGVLKKSKAKILYITNLVTKYGQTHGFTSKDFISELERYLQRDVDYILQNNTEIPEEVLERYKGEQAYKIVDDFGEDSRVIRCDLLSDTLITQTANDSVRRSLLRHSSEKIAIQIDKILQKIYK